MEFKENEPIYLQIAGHVSDQILLGKWAAEDKIPSVRDLAVTFQVNPNTVMRTYEQLQNQEVIYNKRGLGFFVTPDAVKKVKAQRKERFLQQDLPAFFRNIYLLEIDLDEIQKRYEVYKSENYEQEIEQKP
ncbi:GntR family transcriptional regulator [Pontibacter sp. HSC-36F09]|uniref:GntR family transcriptional regulator n=1 Tax=Pontibacter sp. HSC-36F09 TaxID=2910966 RepID=UPI00209D861E|nr:GntR family transcriptional regulator [Pontibacter sp. HSC-36F09]MCP2043846.1 DNA-binding transcriptional regulator YhcF (GntR family) [Pontibacter sp. HSC-36F09]